MKRQKQCNNNGRKTFLLDSVGIVIPLKTDQRITSSIHNSLIDDLGGSIKRDKPLPWHSPFRPRPYPSGQEGHTFATNAACDAFPQDPRPAAREEAQRSGPAESCPPEGFSAPLPLPSPRHAELE